jgi:hypothetical protein
LKEGNPKGTPQNPNAPIRVHKPDGGKNLEGNNKGN